MATVLESAWRVGRFALTNALLLIGIGSLVAGGSWPWAALALTVFLATLGDEAAGDDRAPADRSLRGFYDANLFLALPLMLVNAGLFLAVSTDGDPFGIWVHRRAHCELRRVELQVSELPVDPE
jgi:hypothetical protein